ncbi:MAG: Holliday junction branch migration protein RuvA [Coriobacteriia bacterium]|nr:Holliday junction branch migration protein RuvA [Coriobacteriia bacterium]MBN2839555.1 Holliday junction branch migration protein RuvA [Coriobacteriia bacterium]
MIAQLTGRVAVKSANSCIIDVGGVGFRLAMATGALAHLPAVGDDVTVYTHLQVREDELSLYGFESLEEQELFEKLIAVNGVGPKVALSVLSALSPAALRDAVLREDDALIATVPGIGKKTAQRLIIDLKDRIGELGGGVVLAVGGSVGAEASDALASMGFSAGEIAVALKGYDGPDDARALLRHALKRLGGSA